MSGMLMIREPSRNNRQRAICIQVSARRRAGAGYSAVDLVTLLTFEHRGGKLGAGLDAEFVIGAGQAGLHGFQADVRPLGDLAVGQALVVAAQHLAAGQQGSPALEWHLQVLVLGEGLPHVLGQGPGSVGTPPFTATPLTVGGFTSNGTVGISSGSGSAVCALNASQQAFCWGDDSFGELGDNDPSFTDSGTPVAVQGL